MRRVILTDVGFSVSTTFLLIAPPYILAVIVAIGTSYWADRIRHRTRFIFFNSALAIVGFGLMAASVRPAVKLFGVFLAVAGAAPNIPAVLAFAQNNIIGTSKRAVTSGFQIGFGAIGGIAASTVFRQQDAPRYLPGYFALMTMLIID
jgi:ethanolamine transporter EutH